MPISSLYQPVPSPHDLRAVGATVDIAERHGKPLIFVINAATARARITGKSAVALSQHGTVAPVTIHHRVDFAASMIDGRTVGEIVANCQSAREISDLWLYIQSKLSRIVHDPALLPDFRPDHLAVSPLQAVDFVEGTANTISGLPEMEIPPLAYDGPDRRSGADRRLIARTIDHKERRAHVFGRRQGDRIVS